MRAFNWLKKLHRSERGNIIVLGAATMPLVMGGAAMALDTVQIELWKRQMQRSADSSAIAGAYALAQGAAANQAVSNDLDEHNKPTLLTTTVTPGSFAAGTIASATCAARALNPCYGRAIQVDLVSERRMPFLSMFTNDTVTVRGRAVAAVIAQGEYCMISLYNGTDAGIVASGGSQVGLGCGMATNSRASSAVLTNGNNTLITATPIAAVGGLVGTGNNFGSTTTLQPYTSPQTDPFEQLPFPTPTDSCTDAFDAANPQPGCYSSMNIQSNVTLPPGQYIIANGGDFSVSSGANVSGSGVTIFMTGTRSNGHAGDFTLNGGGTINLSAPETGTYAGMLFFQDRAIPYGTTNNDADVKINGGGSMTLKGAFYFPKADIKYAGNATSSFTCLQMVGQKLDFAGNMSIANSNTCGESDNIDRTVVRLVG